MSFLLSQHLARLSFFYCCLFFRCDADISLWEKQWQYPNRQWMSACRSVSFIFFCIVIQYWFDICSRWFEVNEVLFIWLASIFSIEIFFMAHCFLPASITERVIHRFLYKHSNSNQSVFFVHLCRWKKNEELKRKSCDAFEQTQHENEDDDEKKEEEIE